VIGRSKILTDKQREWKKLPIEIKGEAGGRTKGLSPLERGNEDGNKSNDEVDVMKKRSYLRWYCTKLRRAPAKNEMGIQIDLVTHQ
jgi:hypothetical protein